ncbi:MAG TPA: DNA-binding response regulator [Bacteroidetes bacterium]|nr:DNA-binding response regulator [Bacteroidota bacterium]
MRALVIEDDVWISEMLKVGLTGNKIQATMALNGIDGLALAKSNKFDVVITDVMMPGMSGIEVCRELREFNHTIPIIMLTALDTTEDKILGFEAGADDYLVKPFDFRELLVRIKAVTRRRLSDDGEIDHLSYADLIMDLLKRQVFRGDQTIDLTPREFQLLEYLLRNPERVISRTELSKEVWDKHFETGTNFVDVYINYVRNKIDKEFDTKLIHTRQGMGFILEEK